MAWVSSLSFLFTPLDIIPACNAPDKPSDWQTINNQSPIHPNMNVKASFCKQFFVIIFLFLGHFYTSKAQVNGPACGTYVNRTLESGLGSTGVTNVSAITTVTGATVYAALIGGLGISTNGGTSFTRKTQADGLGNNNVNSVYATESKIYAATNGGISYCPSSTIAVTGLDAIPFCPGLTSDVETFSIFGDGLGSSVTITVPAGYEIKTTSGTTFGSSITLPIDVNYTLAPTSVDIRATANATVTSSIDISITSGTNATIQTVTTTVSSVSRMSLQGNAVNIFREDNTPSGSDGTQFGTVTVSKPNTKTYTIQNTSSTESLVVSAITLSGPDAGAFTIGGITLPYSIPTNGSTTFTVTVNAASAGLKIATIIITSNDDCDP